MQKLFAPSRLMIYFLPIFQRKTRKVDSTRHENQTTYRCFYCTGCPRSFLFIGCTYILATTHRKKDGNERTKNSWKLPGIYQSASLMTFSYMNILFHCINFHFQLFCVSFFFLPC